jgi:hypothetical protein
MANSIDKLLADLRSGTRPAISRRGISTAAGRKVRNIAKGSTRLLKRFTWDSTDNMFNLKDIMEDKKIFLGVSDFDDLITSQILDQRVALGKQTIHRETTVLCNRQKWASWAEDQFTTCLFVQSSSSNGFVIFKEELNYITYSVNSNSTTVRAFGDPDFADSIIDLVENTFDVVTSYIEWIYSSDGNSVNVPLNRDRMPCEEMYPFLNGETLGSYYERYMESSANILLLIGPPGTGKTTFIRGLLAHTNSSAMVTYDATILEKDYLFARFIEDDASVMVLEDSDAFLKPRTDGNTMMHRFLNVGDGLVTTKGKKMIFSTNLPSIRDIDSALVRPGRCFDILSFDNLKVEQAQALADKLEVKLPVRPRGKEAERYTIAEVFNEQTRNMEKSITNRKMGFI